VQEHPTRLKNQTNKSEKYGIQSNPPIPFGGRSRKAHRSNAEYTPFEEIKGSATSRNQTVDADRTEQISRQAFKEAEDLIDKSPLQALAIMALFTKGGRLDG